MNLQYLIKYKSFLSVEDMDAAVQGHINAHYDQLTASDKAVLHCLAGHSLTAPGACHLKADTIAQEVGVSVKTVYRATKKLVDLGIITKHKTVKRTGQGASIYVIAPKINTRNVSLSMSESCQSLETHVKPVTPTVHTQKNEAVTSFITSSFNPFVVKNVVKDVNACHPQDDLKMQLRAIYQPSTVEGNQAFDELCRIAFGRLKQYMRTHQMPYLQLEQIVIRCMQQLVAKQGVRNQFAMYSKMIERQVLQLFEQPISPAIGPQSVRKGYKKIDVVPEWYKSSPEEREQQQRVAVEEQQRLQQDDDFLKRKTELEKRLARIGG